MQAFVMQKVRPADSKQDESACQYHHAAETEGNRQPEKKLGDAGRIREKGTNGFDHDCLSSRKMIAANGPAIEPRIV